MVDFKRCSRIVLLSDSSSKSPVFINSRDPSAPNRKEVITTHSVTEQSSVLLRNEKDSDAAVAEMQENSLVLERRL